MVEAKQRPGNAGERGWSLAIFRDGLASAKAGRAVSANPYAPDSDHAAIWLGGWQLGREMSVRPEP